MPTYFTVPERSLFIYADTLCNAVDGRLELAVEVQSWTMARSECLPGGGKNYRPSYAINRHRPGLYCVACAKNTGCI